MYNCKQKENFIIDYLNSRIVSETMIRALFKYTEKFEKNYNKDVSTFNVNEILDMLTNKNSRSIISLCNLITVLKHYTNFVKEYGYELISINNYQLITKDMVSQCVNASIKNKILLTRENIFELEAQMLNDTDRAILECLFVGIAGFKLQNLTNLTRQQLNQNCLYVMLNKKDKFYISNYLCNLLDKAFDETEVVSYSENMTISKVCGYGQLYKEKPNAYKNATLERKYRWVLRRIVIWREYFDIPVLTPKTIGISGLVHEVKLEMNNTNMGLRDFLKTPKGKSISIRRGYSSKDYVDVVYAAIHHYM